MTTIADALKATLDAQWAVPTGGTEPTWYVSDDAHVHPAAGIDYVLIQSYTLTTRIDAVNDTYSKKSHLIEMEVNTPTGDNRLKELADEVERILNTVAITGVNWQKVINRKNISDKRIPFFRERVIVELLEMLASSTGAYGSVTATTFTADHLIGTIDTTTAALTVTNAATVGSVVTAGNVDGVDVSTLSTLAGATVTAAQLEDLLMFGSTNAAYVPCMLVAESVDGAIITAGTTIKNSGANDVVLSFWLPLPTTKGALKLYVSGWKIGLLDADADDYITDISAWKMKFNAVDLITGSDDTTDYNAPQEISKAFAAVDVSGYEQVAVLVSLFCTNASDIDLTHVKILCYYAA